MLSLLSHLLSRNFLSALLAVWLMAPVLAGCLTGTETIVELNEATWVNRLSNTPSRDKPPIPLLAELTLQDYEIILRRIMISQAGFFAGEEPPDPLFADRQVLVFSRILRKELPKLEEDQRLQFKFREIYNDGDVLVEIYGDGEFLVFDFAVLSRDINEPRQRHTRPFNRVRIVPQAGQEVVQTPSRAIVKEPIRRDMAAVARLLQSKLDQVDAAQRKKVVAEEEADRLREIVKTSDRISLGALKDFFSKRKTLQLSLKQNLLSEEEFQTKLKKLMEQLLR